MKYVYGLVIAVLVVVCIALLDNRESRTEPVQDVLITKTVHIKGLTRIGDCNE